jgi:copper chaperone
MCGCQTHAEKTEAPAAAGVSLRVEDMTCGHCAGTIKSAIEGAVPGAKVHADPAARLVSVEGADLARISAIITEAGYTPSAIAA